MKNNNNYTKKSLFLDLSPRSYDQENSLKWSWARPKGRKLICKNTIKTYNVFSLDIRHNFSTTAINKLPITNNQKEEIKKDINNFNETHPKPEFNNPGYPDFENVAKQCRTHEEYTRTLDKYADKHSVQDDLKEHDNRCKEHVVDSWKTKYPDTSSKEVADFVNKEHSTQYRELAEEHPDINHKEGEWREKMDNKAIDYGEHLESEFDRGNSPDGSPTDSTYGGGSPVTPSTACPATPSQAPSDTENERSESFNVQIPDESTSKRPILEDENQEEHNKRQKLEDKETPIDFVINKQATEMPDIQDADGGD
jgi:hypothetical protein